VCQQDLSGHVLGADLLWRWAVDYISFISVKTLEGSPEEKQGKRVINLGKGQIRVETSEGGGSTKDKRRKGESGLNGKGGLGSELD